MKNGIVPLALTFLLAPRSRWPLSPHLVRVFVAVQASLPLLWLRLLPLLCSRLYLLRRRPLARRPLLPHLACALVVVRASLSLPPTWLRSHPLLLWLPRPSSGPLSPHLA